VATVTRFIHTDTLTRFARLIAQGRLAHAYLLVGPRDVGKFETALAAAKLVNCEAGSLAAAIDGCACPSCRKIETGNHPDVHVVTSEDAETIKIDQIRQMVSRMHLRPYEARYKVFIIKDIERISTEAANALLKSLEEPGPNTLMLLTTSVPEANLDTVRSRCQTINLFPKPQAVLAKQLQNDYDVDYSTSLFLAGYTEGCPGKAYKLNTAKFLKFKDKVLDEIVLRRDSEDYIKKLLGDKAQTADALDVLASFYRDLVLLKSGMAEDQVIHRGRLQDLRALVKQYTFEELTDIAAGIVHARKQLKDNLNVKTAMTLIKELIWANIVRWVYMI
jgi:DNA polymerase-3 subunit delta'